MARERTGTSPVVLSILAATSACGPDRGGPVTTAHTSEPPAMVLVVEPEPAAVAPGQSLNICLALEFNAGNVSGIQADVIWDPACLSTQYNAEEAGNCVIEPATQRSTLATRVIEPGRMRALLLDFTNTRPMPPQVRRLFCCQYTMLATTPGECQVGLQAVVASDPSGRRLSIETRFGTVGTTG